MFGPYWKPEAQPKKTLEPNEFTGYCYDCQGPVVVIHLHNKGQYQCKKCGSLETHL